MRRRDFLLLVLILVIGVGFQLGREIKQGRLPLGIEVDGLEFMRGPLRTFSESREAPLRDGAELSIDAGRGDVEVRTWNEPKVRVEVRKELRAESEAAAAKIAGSVRLSLDTAADGLLIHVVPEGGARPGALRSSFTVTAPPQSRLRVTATQGDVTIRGIGGDTFVQTAHGDVSAGDLGGACEIVNRHGEVRVDSVKGKLKIADEHDDVTVSQAGSDVEIDSAHGAVSVNSARGSVKIRNRHGEVRVEAAEGSVDVEAPHCSVTLRKIGGSVTARVEADPLEVSDVAGAATVSAELTSVTLADVRGKIQVSGQHTDVTLTNPGSDVDVRTTHQEIELSGPSPRGFRIEASSDGGEIESDVAALRLPEEEVSRFAGRVGDGHAQYKLFTSHSTIRIQGGSPAGTP
jgi:DUF4097 and DUF4098 domain-containing protein YvlB